MTDRQRDTAFWNRNAKKYAASPVSDEAAYQNKLDETRAVMPAGGDVFEFGCGTGTTALWHAPHAGRVLAIDFSEEMIGIARQKAEAAGVTNVEFRVGAIEEFEAPDGSFDVVMAHSILHLVPDPEAAIARSFALLRPGGHFVSSTVTLLDGYGPLRFIVPLMRLARLAPRVWFHDHPGLRRMIEAAGFEIVTDWGPRRRNAAFLIARKPDGA